MHPVLLTLLADPAVTNAIIATVGGVFAYAFARVQGDRRAKLRIDIDQQTNAGLIQAIERAVFSALTRGAAPAVVPQIVADTIGQRMPDAVRRVVSKDAAQARTKLVGLAEDAVSRIVSAQQAPQPEPRPAPTPAAGPQERSF